MYDHPILLAAAVVVAILTITAIVLAFFGGAYDHDDEFVKYANQVPNLIDNNPK